MSRILTNRLSPLIKYPGGKDRELKHILRYLPNTIRDYYEPFVGGGAVFFALDTERYFINDKSADLMLLYSKVKKRDDVFIDMLNQINVNWKAISDFVDNNSQALIDIYQERGTDGIDRMFDALNFFDNFNMEIVQNMQMNRMRKIERERNTLPHEDIVANIEGSIKAAFYYRMRRLLNGRARLGIDDSVYAAVYFFIRQTCYSSMFRYNTHGEFNVPYGGISYNRNQFDKKIEYFNSEELHTHLMKTELRSMDFYDFMQGFNVHGDDFVFVDPPYDTEFNSYNGIEFGNADQNRLAAYLIANGERLYIADFEKKYGVSFMDRNDKRARHLLITNYLPERGD
jgi:DNA adenine methylase